MAAAASLYEGYLDYKGPKDKHFKYCFAQLLPKQLLLKEQITSEQQSKSLYIQPGKYGEGKSNDKKKYYEFYMDAMSGRHLFKVNVMSQRKAWLEYFKIADEQVDMGVYDKVVIHSQTAAHYGNIEAGHKLAPYASPYHTMPPMATAYTQHYGNTGHIKKGVKPVSSRVDLPLPSIPVEKESPRRGEALPPLPPWREDVPPPLPPWREDVPPPLPPGREEVSPPLPPGREEVPPPLPPGREEVSPPLPSGREVTSSLPPGQPIESHLKQQGGLGILVSHEELQKVRSQISDSGLHLGRVKDRKLDKRDSGNVSGDGTIFHHSHLRSGNIIKVLPNSAPSSCEGHFGPRSYRDEGYPTSNDSSPSNSGGSIISHGTVKLAGDHLTLKWCMEGVDRDKAQEIVKSERDGTLLYRINGDKHAITVKRTNKIYHHRVEHQDGRFIFKGLDVTGSSVYDIVSNYIDHCKGNIVPYGGSIDARKEGHEEYDKPWNPPDVKILGSKNIVEELIKKQKKTVKSSSSNTQSSPSGNSSRRVSAGQNGLPKRTRSNPPVITKTSSSSMLRGLPIVEDEQTDYVNEGEDADDVYENTEPDEVYVNRPGRDDIYQNTPDISNTNVDKHETYVNVSQAAHSVSSKLPKATPRVPGGDKYVNVVARHVQDESYSDANTDPYLKIHHDDEPEELYEEMEHVN